MLSQPMRADQPECLPQRQLGIRDGSQSAARTFGLWGLDETKRRSPHFLPPHMLTRAFYPQSIWPLIGFSPISSSSSLHDSTDLQCRGCASSLAPTMRPAYPGLVASIYEPAMALAFYLQDSDEACHIQSHILQSQRTFSVIASTGALLKPFPPPITCQLHPDQTQYEEFVSSSAVWTELID